MATNAEHCLKSKKLGQNQGKNLDQEKEKGVGQAVELLERLSHQKN